nr:MAG TPA: transposase [Caudoviricetes sp.]
MNRIRIQIMNQFDRKSLKYRAVQHYWQLFLQDSCKLNDKRFDRPVFRMHLTNQEIVQKLLSYSQELKDHYAPYKFLLFHFQEKQPNEFFGFMQETLPSVHPLFRRSFGPLSRI